jgi:hypothetical protein
MSVYIFLLIIFAISIVLSMFFGNRRHRFITFIGLVPLTWAIAIAAPRGPALFGKEEVRAGLQIFKVFGELIGFNFEKARDSWETGLLGEEEAERRRNARAAQEIANNQRRQHEKNLDERAKSWTPFWLSIALAGTWTIFATFYTVFSVVAQARSNPSSRVSNDFVRWTIGILVVYLLFKFKWLRGNDGGDLRRSVEYFGLHMFYNRLLG